MPEENDTSEKFYGLGDAGFKDAVMDLTAEDAGGCCCGWLGQHVCSRHRQVCGLGDAGLWGMG